MNDDARLSRPNTARGRMQRLVLQVQLEYEAAGELPTSGRFVFYEMETAGLVRKSSRGESRRGSGDDPREQEVTDALIWLRDKGVVPWTGLRTRPANCTSGNTPRRSPSLSGPPSISLGSIRGPVSRR